MEMGILQRNQCVTKKWDREVFDREGHFVDEWVCCREIGEVFDQYFGIIYLGLYEINRV